MDIDKVNFPFNLLNILEAISESHLVAIDLELSGVPVRSPDKRSQGKQTLQERYLEIKEAAETYQILQVGLTCVQEDLENDSYELKPYNINISPGIDDKFDIGRKISFHSGAIAFLVGVGFDFQLPFTWGVPYLSRDEEKLAKTRANARHDRDRAAIPDMDIKPDDTEALEVMRRVRSEIESWKQNGNSKTDPLTIGPRALGEKRNGPYDELNRYEKRLIHQLVRAEHPDLVTISKRGVIQIIILDQEREDRIRQERRKEAEERIHQQTGFRWVIEAIRGGSLSDINVKSFATNPDTGEPIFADMDELQGRFSRAKYHLRKKPRVVVGHNCFLDLVYIYQTFIGALPDTVEGFQTAIHTLFPNILDTKYLATHNCGDINPMSSLQHTAEQLEQQQVPAVTTHPKHGKYAEAAAFHEAGYDSLLTAQIAVRLSAKLAGQQMPVAEAAGSRRSSSRSDVEGDGDGGGVQLNSGNPAGRSDQASRSRQTSTLSSAVAGVKDMLLTPVKALGQGSQMQKCGGPQSTSRFAHAGAFDQLADGDGGENEETVLQFDDLASANAADTDGPIPEEELPPSLKPLQQKQERLPGGPLASMPRFDEEFWQAYGNKLRVFGTQGSVCEVGKWEAPKQEAPWSM